MIDSKRALDMHDEYLDKPHHPLSKRASSCSDLFGAGLLTGRQLTLAGVVALALAGCATETSKHGHLFTQSDIQRVQMGMSTDQVSGVLGTPDTTSTVDGQAFYYISSTTAGATFLQQSEVDRTVLAVYFDQFGAVQQVANYSMKDGRVIDTIARTTPAAKRDKSFIESIFRGVGKKKNPIPEG
jgi:outer membrane protein assembly factor BamE (lipoprotein component of BamABCDE complex)